MSDIAARVRAIFIEKFDVDEAQLTDDTKIVEDLGADSLDKVELILAFEEEFKTEIPEEDTLEIETVGQAIKLVTNYL